MGFRGKERGGKAGARLTRDLSEPGRELVVAEARRLTGSGEQ